uniref:Uncharacterized protein n=1 Tax=Sphaerodactylus townsendi TaxID=933632 RepID=A0ACB8G6Z4_9SAUR
MIAAQVKKICIYCASHLSQRIIPIPDSNSDSIEVDQKQPFLQGWQCGNLVCSINILTENSKKIQPSTKQKIQLFQSKEAALEESSMPSVNMCIPSLRLCFGEKMVQVRNRVWIVWISWPF